MELLILFGFVFLLSFIVNILTGVSKRKNQEIDLVKITKDAQIETGYPTSTMRSLHINSTIEPTLPYHKYKNEQLNQFEEKDYIHTKEMFTKNMFVESNQELNLSLFERELTKQMVIDAYEKVLNEHLNNIEKGLESPFELSVKKEARNYLLNNIKPQK